MTKGRKDKRIYFALLGVFVAVFLFTFLAQKFKGNEDTEAANLSAFDPGYIISDYQMSNYNSMSEAEIQSFLNQKGNCNDTRTYLASYYPNLSYHIRNGHFVCLADETFGDGVAYGDGVANGASAAHIIWQAAQDYRINPQVLIVLLQKEQGLITDSWPNDRQYRSATGYGCPDTTACSSKYYGFKNQVRNAASLFRTVLDGGWTNYPLGSNYIQYNPNSGCGGSWVNIRSLATSALYRYTPYQPNTGALAAGYGTAYCGAYGNRNFYLYFEDWFGGISASKNISAPRNIQATQTGNSIVITWEKPSDTLLYGDIEYEIVLADNKKNETVRRISGNNYRYTFENLNKGLYTAASVKAITGSGSNYGRVTFEYASGDPPSSPRNLEVNEYNGGIKISWKAPSDDGGIGITKYEVVLADTNKKEYKIDVDASKLETVFYGLPFGEYFATSVKAINQKGSNYTRKVFSIKNYAELISDVENYSGFMDMPTDETSKKAVSWAAYNGVTDKNNYFNGDSALTRRQAMVLLWRLAGKPNVENYSGFMDMPTDETSKKAVSWAAYNGVTDKNNYFNGDSALTRRQAMVLLWRFYNLFMI